MEQTLSSTQHLTDDRVVGDAELIAAVRGGDTSAYGELFGRHRDAALRLARQVAGTSDADDLVAEAFVRVLALLQDGRGPDEAFRAYLLTSIRRLHIDRVRARNKVWSTAHEAELDRAVEFVDPAEMTFEHGAAAVAFSSLPERWRLVLWHLDVEGQRPAEVAPLLGMSPNGVSALAYRAREGLRQAYLQHHLAPTLHEGCSRTTGMLGSYVRKGLSARDTATVEKHLDGCSRCTGLHLELREVNSNLSGVLGPAVLGPVFAAYLAAGAGLAALGAGAATVSYTHLTLPTKSDEWRSRGAPDH
ncbi:sigma-70 family RNA polymerase sigma factor [Aeromicrobium fastidiosum]|uniref:sigma-70 family RNA polymerase sigma factor n=1 Tax=Aeromicrobium fastidiosum TaxID=52699 RepID=UPI002023723D|nr:sigma-70 family RNA polymerase sigma factor [Aeromicrobium fastidiosum]MCL8252747.1 sigma-70 family RNA polymerase sigma factor [Aeromicrobium fastidiosum]